MGDNYSGGDEHLSQWFDMNQNQQQQHPQTQLQYQPKSQQIDTALIPNDRNVYNTERTPPAAIDRSRHQNYYRPTQYADPPHQRQQPMPAQQTQQQAYSQDYQQQGTFHPKMSLQQSYSDQQQRQQQESQGLTIGLDSTVANSPSRNTVDVYEHSSFHNYNSYPLQAPTSMEPPEIRRRPFSHGGGSIKNLQRTLSVTGTGNNASRNQITNPIAESLSKARSERKRTREKLRRDGVNRQFAELTKVLKRLELDEREESERKARIVSGSEGSMSTSLHSVRLPFIAPNNSVDLIACAIVHLQHLHRVSKRQQVDMNRLEEELQNAKKAGEDTATKLKEVLFNYEIPRPHLGLTNPSFNMRISSSSNNVSNMEINNGNICGSSNAAKSKNLKITSSIGNNSDKITASTTMMAVTADGMQQKQVMMMVPMMMNTNGHAMVMEQPQGCNVPSMILQPMKQGVKGSTPPIRNQPNANNIVLRPSARQQPTTITQPVEDPMPYEMIPQQAAYATPLIPLQHQNQQQRSQSLSRIPSQETPTPIPQQQQRVIDRAYCNSSTTVAVNDDSNTLQHAQHISTETGNPPTASQTSGVFAAALAAALSNLRGGNAESQDQQQEPIHTPPPTALLHNASTSDHAAALGAAIAASPVINVISQASGPANCNTTITTPVDSGNTDMKMPSVTLTGEPSAVHEVLKETPEVNSGDGC